MHGLAVVREHDDVRRLIRVGPDRGREVLGDDARQVELVFELPDAALREVRRVLGLDSPSVAPTGLTFATREPWLCLFARFERRFRNK